MNKKIRWIAETAVLLALLVALQAITKPLGQLVTGSCVNGMLAVAALLGSLSCGVTVAVVSPILAFLLGIAPQILTVPAIMVGNALYVLVLYYVTGRSRNTVRQIAAWIGAATVKFAALYAIVAWLICGVLAESLLAAGLLKKPMLQALPATFSWPQLATALIREINPDAITIAEDMSAMPGMCLPIEEGGIGFDYRLAMGLPDLWIKLIKTQRDENWNMWHIWHELTSRRPAEKYVGYAESHDQALVGDKTIMFRLCDANMYTGMSCLGANDPVIDRGIALHKMIRLLSMSLGGEGYLNFMGNEFGHPEWIDFPREGNNWSYFYCRRQWHLADDQNLKYKFLQRFDRAMINFAKEKHLFKGESHALQIDEQKQVLVYERGGVVFAVNLSPYNSYTGYGIKVPKGKYQVVLSTDEGEFGGYDRISKEYIYTAEKNGDSYEFPIYLPARTALCLVKVK